MRAAGVVIVLCAALVLAACGSESSRQASPPPRLPRALAARLAGESDALATRLARSDECGARTRFHHLERETRDAVSSGDVPVELRAQLLAAVRRLGSSLPACTPPPPPPPPARAEPHRREDLGKGKEKNEDRGKGKEKHGEKKHGKKDE
jgi:hypothetical protein